MEVMVDEDANGPRLLIRDLQSGESIHLDPLELEALTRLRHSDLKTFLDPSFETGEEKAEDDERLTTPKL